MMICVSQSVAAMLHGVVVVFSVFSLALGEMFPVVNHNNSSVSASGELNPNVQGVCYFGRVPSARCMFRCFMKGSTAYCDEAQCLCRAEDHHDLEHIPEYNHTASAEVPTTLKPYKPVADNETTLNQTEPAHQRITFLIFDLSKLFGVPEENSTEVLDKSSHIIPKDNVRSQQLWTLPHILAMAILTLLTVLVVLEILHCCRRHNRKHQFQTVLSPPSLEKVYVSEKQ